MKKCVPVAIALIVFAMAGHAQSDRRQETRPNIVFILIDDLRWDELGIAGHPFLKTPNIDRIGSEGALFRNAFLVGPLCSPSRASFLTGQYPHVHGITDNVDRSAASHKLNTFPLLLHQSGYATAFIGKWHMGNDDSPRPGFDRWVSFKGQGSYLNPEINDDGRDVKPNGYITDLLTTYAVEFIRITMEASTWPRLNGSFPPNDIASCSPGKKFHAVPARCDRRQANLLSNAQSVICLHSAQAPPRVTRLY
jgi:N-acetylglucosamine-6-sulfatase